MTHKTSQFKILTACDHGYIGVCECCNEFNFAYKNILLTFQKDDLCQFFDWIIAQRDSPKHYMPLHHGRNRVFTSPNSNLFIAFHDTELDEVEQMYNEMKIVITANSLLLSNRLN